MNWKELNSVTDLDGIVAASADKPQVLFKHSTRCSISVTAKNRLDAVADSGNIDVHYLDLLNHRDISNEIAERFKVHHESPQVIVIKNGEVVYDESHLGITWADIVEQV